MEEAGCPGAGPARAGNKAELAGVGGHRSEGRLPEGAGLHVRTCSAGLGNHGQSLPSASLSWGGEFMATIPPLTFILEHT